MSTNQFEFPDRDFLTSVLPRFDGATQAVATGVVVQRLAPEEVARALGVTLWTVSRKLRAFLDIARRQLAVTVATAALAGCGGGAALAEPVAEKGASAGEHRAAVSAAAKRAGEVERAPERPVDVGAKAASPAAAAIAPVAPPAVDLEFSEGLAEPSQEQVVSAPEPWRPSASVEEGSPPVIADVWPDKGPASGGDRVVIRGKDLQAAQVVFGLVPAVILEASDDHLVVAAPAGGAGRVAIVVTNRDGHYAVADGAFQYYL
jgi:IPT/TIG domain